MTRWLIPVGTLAVCLALGCSSGGTPAKDTCDTGSDASCNGGAAGDASTVAGVGNESTTTGGQGGGTSTSGTSSSSGGPTSSSSGGTDTTGAAGSDSGGTGGGAGAGTAGTGTSGASMQPLYLLWGNNFHGAAIMELHPQTGAVTDTTLVEGFRGWATDLAVAPDGTLRLFWSLAAEAGLWIFNTAIEQTDSRAFTFPGSDATLLFSKGPNGRGKLLTNHLDGIHVNELDTNDDLTFALSIYHAGARPVDYWLLANGDARVLTTPEQGQTSVIPIDQYGDPIGSSVDCENPGWAAVSYAIARDGTVWVSYISGTSVEVRVCAYADESSFNCELADEGWGPGGCTTYTYTDASYAFYDLAISP